MSILYTWNKITSISPAQLENGQMQEIQVGEKRIGLLMKNGELLAFSAICPHAGASLCEGWVDIQGRIVCPLHKYRFDPQNGRNTSGEGYKLRTYPLEIRDGHIYIGLQL